MHFFFWQCRKSCLDLVWRQLRKFSHLFLNIFNLNINSIQIIQRKSS